MDFKGSVPKQFGSAASLSKKNAQKEIQAIRNAVHYHNRRYYHDNDPAISDTAYDRLFHRLEELEKQWPELQSADSPTHTIGSGPLESLNKRKHQAPMQSLQASLQKKDVENFISFVKRNTDRQTLHFWLEPKFDGLSVEMVYEHGSFHHAVTRGDGFTGEDISHTVTLVNDCRTKLKNKKKVPSHLSVRGEILMSKKGFMELNRERIQRNQSPFANPRNAASGVVRQLDPQKAVGMPLMIVCYDIINANIAQELQTQHEVVDVLSSFGFHTPEVHERCTSIEDIEKYRNRMIKKRDSLNYDCDGIVVKLHDRKLHLALGERERNPRWAYAWKFEPKREITQLYDIIVHVGRTGILTPVALLEPVDIGGVTVSRATLHNAGEVHRKDIRVGDSVQIARAGDVIPEVVKRIPKKGEKRKRSFSMPKKCPSCKGDIIKQGAYHICVAGLSCPAQLKGRLHHYASRAAMNINSLGERTIAQMVDSHMVHDISDLYRLRVEDFMTLERFAQKSAHKLHDELHRNTNPPLDRFIYALGIHHVGEHIARVLARQLKSLNAIRKARKKDLLALGEIGEDIAESITSFFSEKRNVETLDKLIDCGIEPHNAASQSSRLKGMTFVLTGELDSFTRSEVKKEIENQGGHASSSVSGNTDYLVVGKNPGSKLEQAQKKKVEIVDEKAFRKMITL